MGTETSVIHNSWLTRTFNRHWDVFLLLWLMLILFWGESWEAQFGMDSMTYASLARHIISTGDWWALHYSTQAYQNFYQHPPLGVWVLAGVFRLTGNISEVTAKITPFIFCLGTLLITIRWGRRATATKW